MSIDFEIADLRSFVATVRAGSLTRGAAALGLTQPAVSQRIQRLERAAGERVILRDKRGARVTPAGETLLAYAERVLALHDEARESLNPRNSASTGRRTVALLEDLAITTLPVVLADFAALHPRIELEVRIATAAALRRRAAHGEIDLALGDPSIMTESSVRWRRQVALEWICGPALDPLVDPLPLVMFSQPCEWRQTVLDALGRQGRSWRIAFQCTSVHGIQAAVAAGLGVGTLLASNIPANVLRLGRRHNLPPAPHVGIAISRRAGTDSDTALDTLERLLLRAVTDSTSSR
jgi:DNA-binding transcriptional LysR family regulator